MAVSSEKITVYNLADLKNTSDDAIPNYLNSLKFKQSHTLTDVRLGLGYSAFLIAAACFLWDYKFGFESTKYYTAGAVIVYSILNSALTLWIWLKEKGIIYVGTAPNGETVTIATSTKKNVPIYNLTITLTSKASSKPQNITLARSFTEWFDEKGHFVALPFQTMLASNVPVVGKFDPKRATLDAAPAAPGQEFTVDELDALIAGDDAAATSGSAAKKGGKRRKV
ncbi:hypothetical protein N0V82_009274 [Gnomoniopsis sp. IMI 355080]|nr:hypothetical protein N0V82_009274 [Gnomoniopsis sp. IMI 355080]